MKTTGNEIKPYKQTAMTGSCQAHPGRGDKHPDHGCSHAAMDDSMRNAPTKSYQSAPDHGTGKGHPDHFRRERKA